MPAVLTWVDAEPAGALPLPDRGLAFGDGLFETMLLIDGRPQLADYHVQRLCQGLDALLLPDIGERFSDTLSQVARHAPAGPAALRVTVTRGGGPRGYRPPLAAEPRLIAQLTPLDASFLEWQPPARVGKSSVAWSLQPRLAGIKHLNRLEQVLAAAECGRANQDEAVMLDTRGRVVSLVSANLFVLKGRQLLTPAVTECGIAGTRRRAVLERWAPQLGLAVAETVLHWGDLLAAEEVFYCNALTGIRAIASLEASRQESPGRESPGQAGSDQAGSDQVDATTRVRRWSQFPVARALHRHYRTMLAEEAAA